MNKMPLNLFRYGSVICLILIYAAVSLAQEKESELQSQAKQFLFVNEPKLQETKDLSKQHYLLSYLAPAALCAGETEKANNFAQQLLVVGQKLETLPGFGPGVKGKALHTANIVFGRIALENGDIEKAKEHLLAAGQIIANPTLKTFGPDMLLAKQLIEKGERETAIKYFDLCAKFWKMDDGRLAQWKKIVKEGGMPDFKANLRYETTTWRFAQGLPD